MRRRIRDVERATASVTGANVDKANETVEIDSSPEPVGMKAQIGWRKYRLVRVELPMLARFKLLL